MTKEEIRTLRRALGLSTTEFGSAVGMSSGRIVEDWEQGRRNPSGPARKMMGILLEQHKNTASRP